MKCLSTVPLTNHTSVTPAEAGLLSVRPYPDLTHRPIPAPEPDPEPNPGPDADKFLKFSFSSSWH